MGYSHGVKWTDEKIKAAVLEVVEGMELKRMPTRSECSEYLHNDGLSCAISKRIGWYALAKEMGLPVKESETTTGKTYENKIAESLRNMGHDVELMPQNFPYDLLVNNCVKVDVKASHKYSGTNGDFYSFGLEKAAATCDLYILVVLDGKNEIVRTMCVPSVFVMHNTQISVGIRNSRYHKFTGRWDYIDKITEFWDSVKSET